MSLFARLKKTREEKKGFTLVELIVVLVILAILAAILVPALTGWIDEAKKKNFVLEARNIYTAAQAVADELYAKKSDVDIEAAFTGTDKAVNIQRIQTLSDNTTVDITGIVAVKNKINGIAMTFEKDNQKVTAMLNMKAGDGGGDPTAEENAGWVITTAPKS